MAFNFLGTKGYLTDKQRKETLEHGDFLTFKTSIDASETIQIYSYGIREVSVQQYADEIASFICWWTVNVHKDLNGFSGFGKFQIVDFKIV